MRKKKLMLVVSILSMGLAFTSIGYATEKGEKHYGCKHSEMTMESSHYRSGPSQHMSEGKHHSIASCILKQKGELGLTDEQVSQLKSLKSENEKQLIRDEAEMKVLKIELHDLVHQDKVDVKAVDTKIEKIGTLFTTMKKNHIYAKLDTKKILTAEQLKKFKEHRESEGYPHMAKEEAGCKCKHRE